MIKNIYQFIRQEVDANPISLEAKIGEAFEIVQIAAVGTGSGQAADVLIGGQKMVFLPAVSGVGMIAPPPYAGVNNFSLFPFVRDKYPDFPRLVVAQGETLDIIPRVAGAPCWVDVWYIRHYGDALPVNTQPGGSQSKNRPFISWAEQLVTVPASTTQINKITTYLTPAGYPNFPFEGIVLPGTIYKMIGLAGKIDVTAAPNTTVEGLRLWKLNESILHVDEGFVPFAQFPMLETGADKSLYLFEQPIVFSVNETAIWEVKAKNVALVAESYLVDLVPVFILEPEAAGA